MISVIITAHNYDTYLLECLYSVFNQSYKHLEVIVVDDNSTDTTEQVVEMFDVKYYRVKFNSPTKSRNYGFTKSSGKYVIFFDADNFMKPNMLEVLLSEIGDYDFIYPRFDIINGKETNHNVKQYDEGFFQFGYIDTPALIKRDKVVKWDESLFRLTDWDFWSGMIKSGAKGKFLNWALYYYRQHEKQWWQSTDKKEHDLVVYNTTKYIHNKYNLGDGRITLLLTTCGRWFCVDKLIESILSLDYPKKEIELLIVENSHDQEFVAKLKKELKGYYSVRVISHGNEVFEGTGQGKNYVVTEALKLARQHIFTKEVFMIEDDITVSPDAIKVLQKNYRELNASIVEGLAHSRWRESIGAYTDHLLQEKELKKDITEITRGGFYCSYTSLAALQVVSLQPQTEDNPGCDWLFWQELTDLGLKGYINRTIQCKHYNLEKGGRVKIY